MMNMTIQEKLLNQYNSIDVQKLDKEVRKNGFNYKLINRTPAKCMYAQYEGGHIVAYEVFKTHIVLHKEPMRKFYTKQGREFDETKFREYKEQFPNDEEFGARAWTYMKYDQAKKAFDEL